MDEKLIRIWKSWQFNLAMDLCRVLLLIVAALILYYFVKEINIVKMLGSDPCKMCMNKTGAYCFLLPK